MIWSKVKALLRAAEARTDATLLQAIANALAPGDGGNTVGLPSTTQFTSLNPANYSANQATPTPTPTPSRPNSPSN